MKKRILFAAISLIILSTALTSAESKQNNKQVNKTINSSIVVFNNLSMAIDFWHDASLKGNKKAVAEHTEMIHEIISDDIKSNYRSISYAKLDASYTNQEIKNSKEKDEQKYLYQKEVVLKTKTMLLTSLKKSKSFAYTYRILADYQFLLKKEIDAEKIEIAEDVSDNNSEAGKVRLIR